MSNSLWPHEPQHARSPCPSPTPRVHPNPCPLSQWCHPTISSSVIPFSSCPKSFPGSRSFQRSPLFASGGQSIGVSASTSVLAMNTQDWPPLGRGIIWLVWERKRRERGRKNRGKGATLASQWLRLYTFKAGGHEFNSDWGTKNPHASEHGQKVKKEKKRMSNICI